MQSETLQKKHSLNLESREILNLTGVEDVPLFDEQTVSVLTQQGNLVIKGTALHITKLSLDVGEVCVEGNISAMQYIENSRQKGLLGRLLK